VTPKVTDVGHLCPPTFSRVPAGTEETGQDCIELAEAYGITLDDWQQDIVRGILRETPTGEYACSVAGLVCSRQGGKTRLATALMLFGLYQLGEQILATSHAVKTSTDGFRRLWEVIQSYPELAARVRRSSSMVGMEYVELDSGARVTFSTRSASAGRGLSIDRLIVDEAEDLPAVEVAALAPTVFSRPRAQSIYMGTAPGPQHDSEAFENLRKSALDGLNPRLAWWEWVAPYGADIDDRELWVRVNPAVASGRIPLQAIEDDRAVLPPDSFRAERLSMWLPRHAAEDALFDPGQWEALTDPDSQPVSDMAIGVDVPPSRDAATVCVAGKRADGRLTLEWYRTEPGVQWVPAWVSQRLNGGVRAVVIDDRGALAELDWASVKVRPTTAGAREVAVAAGVVYDAITEGTLAHRGQVELTKGVLAAKQRPIGGAFGWDRKAANSSVLIAASLALYGVGCERPARPRRGDGNGRRGFVQ
jgi:phage terminase large subunit-like protein